MRLLLPRTAAAAATDSQPSDGVPKRGQEEGILVLEDDPDVRDYAVAALEGMGYRVFQAAEADAAMQLIEAEVDKLDLLLCDVVLPGKVSGSEFAAQVKDRHPGMKIVFMSGYASDLYTHDNIPGFDEALLTKPFRRAHLTSVIQEALAS